MPQTIKKEDGSEETVYTENEIKEREETARTEAIDNYKKENPDKSDEITRLQTDLATAQEDLKKYESKDTNFGNLRKIKDDLEEKVKNLTSTIDEKVKEGIQSQSVEQSIQNLAGGDEETEKKIKYEFEVTLSGVKPKTQAELTKKIQDAYRLATGETMPASVSGGILASGGAMVPRMKSKQAGNLKPEVVDFGKRKFGLSEEDIKKYDKQDFSSTK